MIEFSQRNSRIWSRLGPSGALGVAALELAKRNASVLMLTADLCFFSGLERFKNEYPDRIYNFGIAEQNMIGAAGGLAKEGFLPFATTYASFAASRCADQVRVNMSYMKLPIKLIGLTAGLAAGILGATHMSLEDEAWMCALPNITVISPADGMEIVKCMLAVSETNEPTYIRLTGTMDASIVYREDYPYEIGKAVRLETGEDICIIAAGSMVSESLKAAKLLKEEGISCTVFNMHTIKPLDSSVIERARKEYSMIVVVEEHSVNGGLGSAVARYLAKENRHPPLLNIGIPDFFPHAGDYNYQLEQCGLTAVQIKNKIFQFGKENKIHRKYSGGVILKLIGRIQKDWLFSNKNWEETRYAV